MRDDWPIWHVVTSKHFSASFVEVANEWSLDHLYDAHEVIDVLDELDRKREAAAVEERKRK